MVEIEQAACTRCGLCVELCHEGCLALNGAGLEIDLAECSTCTQCVAVCPNQALTWNGAAPVRFERQRLPSAEALDELFKERRSIRRFKRDKVDRGLLAEIAGYGGYAPTHNFRLRAIVVDDDALIALLDQALVSYCRWIYRIAYQLRVGAILAAWFGYGEEMTKGRPKIEATLHSGHAFHSMPTAFIFVVGDNKTPLSEVSAQYALANMMYYAQAKGVGTCLWANGPLFIDKNARARRELGVRSNEHIYGAMYMGYPAVRFSNKVTGKALPVTWNGLSQ
jgi:nitroreductase/NAD-dependent dihydropyrimidine dehydrogenase PreA subunit